MKMNLFNTMAETELTSIQQICGYTTPEGVKVAARLRINLGSKNSFCSIAEKFGFWDFISATNDLRYRKKKPLLEDVFEAFLGATETMIDNQTKTGVGYACVYKILGAIFDEIEISLKYEDLYDAKTRLKELFDIHTETLGHIRYEEKREKLMVYSIIYRIDTSKDSKVLIGKGSAALKADAEQVAAADALKNLASKGFVKYAPSIYARFAVQKEKYKTTEADVLKIISSPQDINKQFFTRGKSKYQSKYTSTALIHYCRKRDLSGIRYCLEMKADPNIKDIEGMSAVDALLIGAINETVVFKVLKAMRAVVDTLEVHANVISVYYNRYEGIELEDPNFFVTFEKNFIILG